MKKKTKVQLGVIGGCVVLLGASSALAGNKAKSDPDPLVSSSAVEEVSSAAEPETAEVTVYTTAATTAATTHESTADTTAATTPETTPATTVATTQSTTAKPNEKTVYVARSGEGTKYHIIPDCSNMTNPREITISEAEALGYTPCQKCY